MNARKIGVTTLTVLVASVLFAPVPRAHASALGDLMNGLDKITGSHITGMTDTVRGLAKLPDPLLKKVVNPLTDSVGDTVPVVKPVTNTVKGTTNRLLANSERQPQPIPTPSTAQPTKPETAKSTAPKQAYTDSAKSEVSGETLRQQSTTPVKAPDFFGIFPAAAQLVRNFFSHRQLDTTSLAVALGILGAMLAVIVGGVYVMIRRGQHGLATTRHDFQHETVMYRRLSTVSVFIFGALLVGAGAIYVALLRM